MKSHLPKRSARIVFAVILCCSSILPAENASAQETVLDLDFAQSGSIEAFQRQGNPRIEHYRSGKNSLFLDGSSYLRVADAKGQLQFKNGDSIAFEAWIAPVTLANGQQIYIVGKGRTGNRNVASDNQNYAVRLRGINGLAKVSFLFRSINESTRKQQYNRWNSKLGFAVDGSWHHIALFYEFGQPNKIVAYVDGQRTTGSWDMGGPTSNPPVMDRDEVWIGSSLSGNPASTFSGWIRQLKLTRNLSDLKQLAAGAKQKPHPFAPVQLDDSELKDGRVLVEIVEQVPVQSPPIKMSIRSAEKFKTNYLALDGTPRKYARPGVIADRTPAFLVRARIKKELPSGDYEILLRAKSATALLVDRRVLGTLPMMSSNASGHEPVPKLKSYKDPQLYPPSAGHQEKIIPWKCPGGEFVFRFETLVGGKGLRNELGEAVVGIRRQGEQVFQMLSNHGDPKKLTFADWEQVTQAYRKQVKDLEAAQRLQLAQLDAPYWNERHRMARALASKQVKTGTQTIDQIIQTKLRAKNIKPTSLVDDWTFIRRVYLDTIGIPPTGAQVSEFVADDSPDKRQHLVDQLLAHPSYADHWVSYWQDVLAENPGILKPKLNNTGPFRFWIHDALVDNKPMDRFAAELIGMKGSRTKGGPAGFAQATQNDVPAAAKANVLTRAFLGIDLTCARCHDSPSNHFDQRDLFQLAAMIERKPIKLPATSTVPNAGHFSAVKVTLKPGESIKPAWPFGDDLKFSPTTQSDDSRRRLAELITSPANLRFPKVIANRIWSRLFGTGLTDSPDDFLVGSTHHPELLDALAFSLMQNGYDAKQLIREIMLSRAYQRTSSDEAKLVKNLAARAIRSMSAEQIVDSLFAVSGKEMSIGMISFDPEGRRTANTFLNLGKPRRAWELVSLANERDRPALALPRAQSVVDILSAFGWRESRPNPISEREGTRTLVQPLVLSNGDATHRVTQLSDDSAFTRIAITSSSVDQLASQTYLQLLNRPPSESEKQIVRFFLSEGFAERLNPGAPKMVPYAHQFRTAVSWSNHLHPDATKIKLRIEELVRQGDPSTKQLKPAWREKMEDLVWALINSPEFTLIK